MLNRKINFKGAYILASVFVTSLTSGPAIAQVDILQSSKNSQVIGVTSLMSAVIEKDLEGVEFFVRSQPDKINSKNIGGATALHIASRNDSPEIVRILIKNGADVNLKDGEGWTPLMRASLSNNPEIVDILLTNGAKVLDKNEFKESAFVHASVADCDLCLGLMIEKIDLNDVIQKREASKEINDAFVIARNRNNAESQTVLKSGIDDIFESNKVAEEEAKKIAEEKLYQEKLAQREAEMKAQEEAKKKQEELERAQEEARILAQEEENRKALEAQIAQEEALATQKADKPVETVDLSLGEEPAVEGVAAFTKETADAAETTAEDIAQVAPSVAPKKSGWFNLFGLFGSSQESEIDNDNIEQNEEEDEEDAVTEVEEATDVQDQDLPLIVKEVDLPAPTKIIDRENELKIVKPENKEKFESKIDSIELLEPVIEQEEIIETPEIVNEPEKLELDSSSIEEEVEEVQETEDEHETNEVSEEDNRSFFGKLFGFGKKEQKVQETSTQQEEVEEAITPALVPNKVADAALEKADKNKINKAKKFKFKSGPSIMKPNLEVSEPPVSKEALEEEIKKQEQPVAKKSFFARLFGWGNDKKEEKPLELQPVEEKQEQSKDIIEESNLDEIDHDLLEEKELQKPSLNKSSIKKPSKAPKAVEPVVDDGFKIIDKQEMVEPVKAVQEVAPVTAEEPKEESSFSFFGLFSSKKDSFVEQDLDDIVQQEELNEAKDSDISTSNKVEKTVPQVEKAVVVEDKKVEVEEVKKESGFSFFGLFSSSKKKEIEEPKVQEVIEEPAVAPVEKKKFNFKKGPSIRENSANVEEQPEIDIASVETAQKKKFGFFSFLFGE